MKLILSGSEKKVVLGISIIAILIAVIFVARRFEVRSLVEQKRMSVHDRVVRVVIHWGACATEPADESQLSVIWADSKKDFPFYQDAAQVLTSRLQWEFRDSRQNVIQYRDIYDADKNPGGTIKTVINLSTHVEEQYDPR